MAQNPNPNIPYDSHPLYSLRRRILFVAGIGIFLDIITILGLSNTYGSSRLSMFVTSAFLLCASVAFVSWDLVTYGAREAVNLASRSNTNDEVPISAGRESTWPSKALLIWDIVLAILLHWMFWVEFANIAVVGHYGRSWSSETLEAYSNLANLFASILHAIAFWKELLARKRTQWQRDLDNTPCESCGYVSTVPNEPSVHDALAGEDAGPPRRPLLSTLGKMGNVAIPKWVQRSNTRRDGDMQEHDIEDEAAVTGATEPLLATPDESTADAAGPSSLGHYGAMAQSVESVNSVPETVVKKKDKGKKRLVDVE